MQTIEHNFGARIDYWAVTTFSGIAGMVNQVGGLQVRIPFRMQDPSSGSNFQPRPSAPPRQGRCSRSRAIGTACRAGTSADRRTADASSCPPSTQFRKEYRKDPSRLLTWIAAGVRNLDTDLPMGELVDLAFTASRIGPNDVRNVVLPGGTGIDRRAVGRDAVDGNGPGDLPDAKVDGALRPGQRPAEPDRHRVILRRSARRRSSRGR